MGLLRTIRKTRKKEKEMRLLMLGLDNAGKTTILQTYSGESISGIPPTVGFNIKTLQVNGYKVNVWDVGGQKTIRSFWRNYFDTTDGLVWVVDSSDRHRLQDCKQELQNLLQEERLWGASLLILANKQDLTNSLNVSEISDLLGFETIRVKRQCEIYPCSAYDKGSVQNSINSIINDIGKRIYTLR